jgi:DNA-binding MarR family transcriptional regulator
MDDVELRRLQSHIRDLHRQFRQGVPPIDGLSRTAVRLLGAIARNTVDGGGVGPGRIADVLEMTSSNVAAALRELDAAGLIVRVRAGGDARRVTISLTDAGAAAVAENRALRVDAFRDLVERALAPGEREQLAAVIPLLGRLVDAGQATS